jgi:hypothetical protein
MAKKPLPMSVVIARRFISLFIKLISAGLPLPILLIHQNGMAILRPAQQSGILYRSHLR